MLNLWTHNEDYNVLAKELSFIYCTNLKKKIFIKLLLKLEDIIYTYQRTNKTKK